MEQGQGWGRREAGSLGLAWRLGWRVRQWAHLRPRLAGTNACIQLCL